MVLEGLLKYRNQIDERLKSALITIENRQIRESSSHLIMAGGKRLRPALLLAAYEAFGGNDIGMALSVATSIEIIHNWSLVHDDIMDKSPMRRGVPTTHEKWDNNTAILAGDALNNLVYRSVIGLNLEKAKLEKVIDALSMITLELIDGQMEDISMENSNDIEEIDYFHMIQRKTGSLIKNSAKIGGILSDASMEFLDSLSDYGEAIGIAFQLKDDVLDLIGDEKKFGKEIGKDITEGKRTLIVIRALQILDSETKEKLLDILDKPKNTYTEISDAIKILTKCGAIDYAKKKMSEYVVVALKSIEDLPKSEAKASLIELGKYCVDRDK